MNFFGLKPYGVLPSERQIRHFKEYGKKAFFHFSVNTFSDCEWGEGVEPENLFAPESTDVRQWIRVAKAAGFTLAILTAKHLDGFCLWPSKYTEHSVKNSPYKDGKGDIVREFTDACHEYGMAVGIYISPYDRNSKYWGTPEYTAYFNNLLTELLTGYGKIDEVWWDGAGSQDAVYDWGKWAYTVRNLQPDAAIFGSFGAAPYVDLRWVGNEAGMTPDPHYPTVDEICIEKEYTDKLTSGIFNGDRFVIAEVDTSIRPGWFYHEEQIVFLKTPKELVDLWFNSVGNSAIMLLNFPPDKKGRVHPSDAASAINANEIINGALSQNFAANAEVTASSVREGFEPDNIINGNYYSVYAADDKDISPVIEINLNEMRTFDTLIIGEYVELGIRVNGFKIEALTDGEWKLLADRKSIGYKKAVYFGETTSDKLKITIYGAAAAPVIRELGLYNFKNHGYDADEVKEAPGEKFDIMKNNGAKVEINEDGFCVMFGGVFPFNTVIFNGESFSDYELKVFNGSSWHTELCGKTNSGEVTITLPETNKASYMIEIKTDKKPDENLNVRVYNK